MKRTLINALLVSALIFPTGCGLQPTGTVINGLQFEGQEISGLTADQLKTRIQEYAQQDNRTLTLVVDNTSVQVSFSELGIVPDTDNMVKDILSYGREDNIIIALQERLKAFFYPVNMSLRYKIDETQASYYLENYAKKVTLSGHDAYLSLDGEQVVIHPEKLGSRLDMESTLQQLKDMAASGEFETLHLTMTDKDTIHLRAQDLAGIDTIIGTYTTYFNGSDTHRTHNVRLASDKINGVYLAPGQVFSFNDIVGERTAEAGFDDAPVIIDGKLVPGIGGGICQVSSTLFNAALLAGMETVERTPHYSPVSYIPAGRDATVAYGYLDYQFKNPYQQPVYVLSLMTDNSITVYILGFASNKPQATSISVGQPKRVPYKTITKEDLTKTGIIVEEEGSDGMSLTTTRTIIDHDGITHTETFDSLYDPTDRVIIKGKS